MKILRITLLLALAINFFNQATAEQLLLIKTTNISHQRNLSANPAFRIHLFQENWVVATSESVPKEPYHFLMNEPWTSGKNVYIVYVPESQSEEFITQRPGAEILYQEADFVIVAADEVKFGQLKPFKTDGMVRIMPTLAQLPKETSLSFSRKGNPDPWIQSMLDQVSATNITATVQHLQNYGTRNAYKAQSVVAQNWIRDQFQSYGLSVEVMDFNMPSGSASDNVIATLTGTKYPEEYIVLGGHYDSYTGGSAEPGADDNASGTAGVLEIARIMSQQSFDRSIIFCAFSGEEYGLYGSAAYASRAAQLGMDIHGYFNLDMIGYLKPGNTTIKSTLIFPAGAQELASFYTEVASTYLPDFVITTGSLSGGDSDHTSFNNSGFMGIFPFEAVPDYSPYIHTSNDVVGPSYNNEAQAAVFTQASLAAAATLANRLNPPRGLAALAGDQVVELNWTALPDAASFNIYRNGTLISNLTSNQYSDFDVVNGTPYTYYITAIYADSNLESYPSNSVTVTPMPPMSLPFVTNFENGAPYFEFFGGWGLSTTQSYSPSHSITESPIGEYQDDTESFAYLRPFSLNTGFTSAEISFWTKYVLETNYDYMYLEVSTNGTNWAQLAQYNGSQSAWQKKTYNLTSYLGQNYIQFRFRFTSDMSVTEDGMYIDDFQITTEGGYFTQSSIFVPGWNTLSSLVIPSSGSLEDVFAPIESNLIAVQTLDGSYLPQQNINTIGSWNPALGYKVKVSAPCGLTIAGPEKSVTTLQLEAGWSLIPVLSECNVSVDELFSNQPTALEMLKEVGSNNVYWPSKSLANLNLLMPSKAYMVKLSEPVQVAFPSCKSFAPENENHFRAGEITATANTHIFGLSPLALSVGTIGDQLIAYNGDGLAAGILTLEDNSQNVAIAVFGNDSLSTLIDGLLEGEAVQWKLWQASSGYYFDLTPTYSDIQAQLGIYMQDGISFIESFEADATGLSEKESGLVLYPNPANDYLNLPSTTDLNSRIEIFSLEGKSMMRFSATADGKIDISQLHKGIYIINFVSNGKTLVTRFIKK
ncbi:MAG: putative aminopeptidase [Bacteroidetes bacterium]|nr:MAG: putative aminopeptidase [Bacteroidota bacterium]